MLHNNKINKTVCLNICGSWDSGSSSIGSKSSSIGCWYWPTTALHASLWGPWQPYLVAQFVLALLVGFSEGSTTFSFLWLEPLLKFYKTYLLSWNWTYLLKFSPVKSSMSTTGLATSRSSQQPSLIVGKPVHFVFDVLPVQHEELDEDAGSSGKVN